MSANQVTQAMKQQKAKDDKAAADKAPRADGLIGSNTLPTTLTLDGVELSAGDIVQLAFSASALGADEWNALTQAEREDRISKARADLEQEAAAEIEARAKREASRAVLAAKRAETAPAALPAAEQEQGLVWDTTARVGEPRTHQVVIGKHPDGEPIVRAYKLASDVPCSMPLDHAMKFLVDKAFRVTAADGTLIRPVEKLGDQFANIRLEPDQVIVRLEDLSIAALLKQAKLLPDSQRFGTNSAPDDLIAFIVAHRKKANAVGISRGSEGIQEDPEAGQILDLKVPVTA